MSSMSNTHPAGQVTPTATKTAGNEDRQTAQRRHIIEGIVWLLGLITLIAASLIVHQHPKPFPGELELSRAVQALQLPGWFFSFIMFYSTLNNIPPSIAAVVVMVLFFVVMRWFRQAFFLALAVIVGNGIDAQIGNFVGRPRPSAAQLHIHEKLVYNSFPSGHTEHDVVFYGFLLYLSFTKPVREWRYHWWLLPLQIFAVSAILIIGFSRLYEGMHWISDILGGYLSGAIWLFLIIFLYRWFTDWQARRAAQKQHTHDVRDVVA